MKTNLARMAVLAVVAVTVAAPAFAGQTQAERETSKGNRSSDWEYRVAMETGNLPSDVGALKTGSGLEANVPMVESGGILYRVGIDTN